MPDPRPIGAFDSGVGGLSVLREIRALLPGEDLLFCADSAHAPYGQRPQEQVEARSLELCEFLLARGAKALVIACNTATAAAAPAIRARWPQVPVIGVEPAVKPATAATRSGVVGVLATSGTLESARFAALLDRFGHGVQVITQPGIGLVERIEAGELDTPALRALLRGYCEPMLEQGADTLVLGCTHFIFLRPVLGELFGNAFQLIDTGAAVARRTAQLLGEAGLGAARPRGATAFFSSDPARVAHVLDRLWPENHGCAALPPSSCLSSEEKAVQA